jgi:hypothetical protein
LRTGRLGFAALEIRALALGVSAFGLTNLAPLRLVLEPFVGEECLLAGGENKLSAAFSARQNFILVLHVLFHGAAMIAGRLASSRESDCSGETPDIPAGPLADRFEGA